jgi:preprotein translocase subunit SecG
VIALIIILVVVVLIIISLFVKRHGESASPQAGWTATDEVFKDPGTNRLMRVWLDANGERHYVPETHPHTTDTSS